MTRKPFNDLTNQFNVKHQQLLANSGGQVKNEKQEANANINNNNNINIPKVKSVSHMNLNVNLNHDAFYMKRDISSDTVSSDYDNSDIEKESNKDYMLISNLAQIEGNDYLSSNANINNNANMNNLNNINKNFNNRNMYFSPPCQQQQQQMQQKHQQQ